MKIKKNNTVKVFFLNGAVIEGTVISWTDQQSVLKTDSGAKILIYNTAQNVLMVKKNKKEKVVETAVPSESIASQTVSKFEPKPFLPLLVGQVWVDNDGSKYEIVDDINGWLTISILPSGETFFLTHDDFNRRQLTQVSNPIIEQIENIELDLPLSQEKNLPARAKELAELRINRSQLEKEAIRKSFSATINNITTKDRYAIPNFGARNLENGSTTENR
jgi:sRNA-binding regulator protein Hfq